MEAKFLLSLLFMTISVQSHALDKYVFLRSNLPEPLLGKHSVLFHENNSHITALFFNHPMGIQIKIIPIDKRTDKDPNAQQDHVFKFGEINIAFAAPKIRKNGITTGVYSDAGNLPNIDPVKPSMLIERKKMFCNNMIAEFQIYKLIPNPNMVNGIKELAIDFKAKCNGSKEPLFGSIRINSRVPVPRIKFNPVKAEDYKVDPNQPPRQKGDPEGFDPKKPKKPKKKKEDLADEDLS